MGAGKRKLRRFFDDNCERIRPVSPGKENVASHCESPQMKRTFAKGICFVVWLLLALSGAARSEDIKQIRPTGYVTDLVGIIEPQTKTQLEAMCTELEEKTGAQMAIVTVKSLDGNEVQTYANDLFKQLGIGQKKQDNGVMLLVAPNERKYWIEVGYGLEPVINDARAGDAGRLMVPYFRKGDYSGGIAATAWQLAKYIADDKGVTLTGMPQSGEAPQNNDDDFRGIWIWIILGAIAFFIFLGRGGGSGGFWLGALLGSMGRGGSSGSGGGGWGGGGGGFGGFGGGSSGGGGAGGGW